MRVCMRVHACAFVCMRVRSFSRRLCGSLQPSRVTVHRVFAAGVPIPSILRKVTCDLAKALHHPSADAVQTQIISLGADMEHRLHMARGAPVNAPQHMAHVEAFLAQAALWLGSNVDL